MILEPMEADVIKSRASHYYNSIFGGLYRCSLTSDPIYEYLNGTSIITNLKLRLFGGGLNYCTARAVIKWPSKLRSFTLELMPGTYTDHRYGVSLNWKVDWSGRNEIPSERPSYQLFDISHLTSLREVNFRGWAIRAVCRKPYSIRSLQQVLLRTRVDRFHMDTNAERLST